MNADLLREKRRVIKLEHTWWKNKTLENRVAFISAQKSYKKMTFRAKRRSWQDFCNSIEDPKNMALLNKVLKKGPREQIGLLKKPDGSHTTTPIESIDLLLKSHFPNSIPLGKSNAAAAEQNNATMSNLVCTKKLNLSQRILNGNFCSESDLQDSFITEQLVAKAINSFGPTKAPGPDGFKPEVLQNVIKNKIALKRLTKLYQAIIRIGYTPKKWCNAHVIFIPKPGKDDYSNVRSFRGISLMPFLFKALEKVVLWHIEATILKSSPFSNDQHAFRKGYSCETAISDLVDDIESVILRGKEVALSVNLDICGAFDNIKYSSIIAAMVAKKFPNNIVNWYSQYLVNRKAFSSINEVSSSILITQGTAQGSQMAPMIWNLVFESFLKELNEGPIKARAFADDATLLVKGHDPNCLVDLMQESLKKAVAWGEPHGLTFVPEKTIAIFFHRKYKFVEPKKLKINGLSIDYSSVVKYLGIYLDSKLTFKHHLDKKISAAKKLLMRIKNAVGTMWGPSAAALKWAYNGIVIPTFSYGCLVWARACHGTLAKDRLSKLNRLIALSMMPLRKGTPTAGLEVALDLMPLDLKIEELSLRAMLRVLPHNRTKWPGFGEKGKGHLKWGKDMLLSAGVNHLSFDTFNELNINPKYL